MSGIRSGFLPLFSVGLVVVMSCGGDESPPSDPATERPHHPVRFSDGFDGSYLDADRASIPEVTVWPILHELDACSWWEFDQSGEHVQGRKGGWAGELAAGHSATWIAPLPGPGRYRFSLSARHGDLPYDVEPPAGLHVALVRNVPSHHKSPTLRKLFAWAGHLEAIPFDSNVLIDDMTSPWYSAEFECPPEAGGVAFAWSGSQVTEPVEIQSILIRAQPAMLHRRPESPQLESLSLMKERRLACGLPKDGSLWWPVDIPPTCTELQTAFGLWPEPHRSWGEHPTYCRIEVHRNDGKAGEIVWRGKLHPAEELLHHGWVDAVVSLEEYAGERVTIRFACQGRYDSTDLPLVANPTLAPTPDEPHADLPPVILISADTLRPDRMTCYGGPANLTPALDALASYGILFERAYSNSSYTLPSHASMLSGQDSFSHGINRNPMTSATDQTGFLSEFLQEHGYITGAYTGGGFLSASFGFSRGFDRYSEFDLLTTEDDRRLDLIPREGDLEFNRRWRETHRLDQALDFVRANHNRPFFLFLHTFLVHGYAPTKEALDHVDPDRSRVGDLTASPPTILNTENRDAKPRNEKDLEALRTLYDGTLWMLDQELDAFFEELRRLDVFDRAIICFTSDHGEEFGEHLGLGHGRTLYEETVRVPLILRYPGGPRGVRAVTPVWLPDIVPTVLSIVDAPEPPTTVDGHSLADLNAVQSRTLLLETRCQLPWERYALLSAEEKVIWNVAHDSDPNVPEFEWYSLSDDRAEQRSLVESKNAEFPGRRALLESTLTTARTRSPRGGGSSTPTGLELEELRRLGYAIDEE